MEVLRPESDPLVAETPATAATAAAAAEEEASPRTKRLITNLLHRVFSLDRLSRSSSRQTATVAAECNGSTAAAAAAAASVAMAAAEQQRRRCPYAAVEKNPSCPYVFQMPLHYPRYRREEYEAMPEWQLDRLLQEYGLPTSGSLPDKRDYAMGAFLWR